MSTRDDDTDRLINELFQPPPRPVRETRDLMLLNPWTRMYHLYRLDAEGLKHYRTFGPVTVHDAGL